MMNKPSFSKRPVLLALVLALAAPAGPAIAQSAGDAAAAETRLRKLEAEIAALQRQVFPGGDGKYFAPLVQPGTTDGKTLGTPASTPVSDLLVRMDAVEAQLARLTSQQEVTTNKLTQLEAKVTALAPPPPAAPALAAAGDNGAVTAGNLGAMTGGAAGPKPAAPAPAVAVAPEAAAPKPAVAAPTPKPVVAAPAPKPATPSAQRLAAVKAVEKPATADPADDEYSYGFRLWEKKFYPEAQQQLKLYLQKYPRHGRVSFARNLLGRAYLDEGNPREAASWFLQNYQASKTGDRAPDSLLFLAEAMHRLNDTNRACVALAQFVDDYPREVTGRLKSQYEATRAKVKCS